VRDKAALNGFVEHVASIMGTFDIVVASAGINSFAKAHEMSEEFWQTTIDINLTGAWRTCRAALPGMLATGRGGAIILISSSAAHIGLPNLGHYAAAKAGLVGLMQSLAVELGPSSIRVNTIHPTAVRTTMSVNQGALDLFLPGEGLSLGDPEADRMFADAHKGINAIPVDWLEPEDIANAALFLASESGRYVTGTQLRIDAGAAAR
jgi:NAD(P)-dependent dehydrogenase (short-subunit alcohol dehydrogenase family)